MQATFNAKITIVSRLTGDDDDSGNKTYTYPVLLTDELCRAYNAYTNRQSGGDVNLSEGVNWIRIRVRRFTIKDVSTDLSDATHVFYNSKYYKLRTIIEPESFTRMKHRTIEAEYNEGKG